jgi:hypothetical protein
MDDLTYNQELFVAMVASEQVKMRVRLAGGEVKEKPSRRKTKNDSYGELLEQRQRFKGMDAEFSKDPEQFMNKL